MQWTTSYVVIMIVTSPYLDHLSILPTDVVKIQLLPFTKAVSDERR